MVETAARGSHKGFADVIAGVRYEVGAMICGVPRSKQVATYSALAIVFLLTGFLFVTLGLLDLVAFALRGNSYAWILAFVVVGGVWFLIGAIFAIAAALNESSSSSQKDKPDELRSAA
jgi:hypothetical protein